MRLTQKLFSSCLVFSFVLFSCGSSTDAVSESSTDTTSIGPNPDTEVPMNYAHPMDFDEIKSSILEGDLEKLKTYCNNDKVDAEMLIELFKDEDFSAQLKDATYDDLTETEIDGNKYQEFGAYVEGSDEEGNVYESGVYIYFDFSGPNLVVDYFLAAG